MSWDDDSRGRKCCFGKKNIYFLLSFSLYKSLAIWKRNLEKERKEASRGRERAKGEKTEKNRRNRKRKKTTPRYRIVVVDVTMETPIPFVALLVLAHKRSLSLSPIRLPSIARHVAYTVQRRIRPAGLQFFPRSMEKTFARLGSFNDSLNKGVFTIKRNKLKLPSCKKKKKKRSSLWCGRAMEISPEHNSLK